MEAGRRRAVGGVKGSRERKGEAADAEDMTSTFYSALDLIAWSLKGEGLNYAVSGGENGDEYLLTKIHSGRRSDDGGGATTMDSAAADVPDGVVVHVGSGGVSFPLTVSNSVREIVSKKWILPSLRRSIEAAERGLAEEGADGGVELRKALDDSKSEFYSGGGSSSQMGGIAGVVPGSSGGVASQRAPAESPAGSPAHFPEEQGSGAGARRLPAGEQMPGFEDDFQLQPGNRNDLRGPFGAWPDSAGPAAAASSSSFGDFDLYPNGERTGQWGDPLGGAAGTAGGPGGLGRLGGLGGMHPQFDDPLFRGGLGGSRGSSRDGPRRGRGGFGPNIRYDDPTGGSHGF